MHLDLSSEPVSPTGSISSTGILNQLGRPDLDLLAVLIRETVQNSWDARRTPGTPIYYGISGFKFTSAQRKLLREQVFGFRPPKSSLSLAALDEAAPLYGLMIADRGTTGLAGPTRADMIPEDAPRNFVSFLRDVGQPSDQPLSGGTYGFGKASLFRASGLRTIIAYTRCAVGKGHFESRFIAAALGEKFSQRRRQFTGRHWWGRLDDNVVEPILNDSADEMAAALGMDTFAKAETGTTILILDPLFSEQSSGQEEDSDIAPRTPLQAMNLMAEYLLCFFWPKMLSYKGKPPAVKFELWWEDKQIPLPNPAEFPPLMGFVEAMQRLKKQRSDAAILQSMAVDISSERPRQFLGKLALQQFIVQNRRWFDTGESSSPFDELTHHTALMRQAELVVKYLEGRPMPSAQVGYAGVFITDEQVDKVFANAEPPTHDDWNAKSLPDAWHKRYVTAALRKVREAMGEFLQPPRTAAPAGVLAPLGAFATWLGESLIPAEIGTAASLPRPRPNMASPGAPLNTNGKPDPYGLQAGALSGIGGLTSAPPGSLNTSPEMSPAPSSGDPDLPGLPLSLIKGGAGVPNTVQPPAMPTPQPPADSGGSSGKTKPRRVIGGHSSVVLIADQLIDYDDGAALRLVFGVKHAEKADGSTITLRVRAVLDSETLEDEPPVGASAANILCWISPDGTQYEGSDQIYIDSSMPTDGWQVLVALPDDIMVNADLEAKAEAG